MKEFFDNLLLLILVGIAIFAPLILCYVAANWIINSDLPLIWKYFLLR
jgi:hypothetical protein